MVSQYGDIRTFAAAVGVGKSAVGRWIIPREYGKTQDLGSARRMGQEGEPRMTDETWFDIDDWKQRMQYDEQLWKMFESAHTYYENEPGADIGMWAEIGVVEGPRLGLNHPVLDRWREGNGGLDSKMLLRLGTRDKRVVTVIRLVDQDGGARSFEIDAFEQVDPRGIEKSDRS